MGALMAVLFVRLQIGSLLQRFPDMFGEAICYVQAFSLCTFRPICFALEGLFDQNASTSVTRVLMTVAPVKGTRPR
jgi:hypothetical protein